MISRQKLLIFSGLALTILTTIILVSLTSKPETANFLESDFVVNIPQQTIFGNYLNISVEAKPGRECKLTFIPPSGNIREMETVANSDGLCQWRWQIVEADGRGHGRLIFTIDGSSNTHFIDIRPGF